MRRNVAEGIQREWHRSDIFFWNIFTFESILISNTFKKKQEWNGGNKIEIKQINEPNYIANEYHDHFGKGSREKDLEELK